MPSVTDPLAVSSSSDSFGSILGQPWIFIIIVALVLVTNFAKAASRKKRANQAGPQTAPARAVQRGTSNAPGVAHQPSGAPYVGTLLNGVPLNNYESPHGHQTTGFANERMRAEAELKRQLDALDAARRSGQVTAEQYSVHREAIFKNF